MISENEFVCEVTYKKIVLIFHEISMTKGAMLPMEAVHRAVL